LYNFERHARSLLAKPFSDPFSVLKFFLENNCFFDIEFGPVASILSNKVMRMGIHIFPLTYQIRQESDKLLTALQTRSAEIRKHIEAQPLTKQISLICIRTIGLESAFVTVACLPVALLTFTAAPLAIAGVSLATAITCLALHLFFDPISPGESIVKDQWKALFEALQHGNGKQIVQICQALARQDKQRSAAFVKCLGGLQPMEVTPFFHKVCMAGYLLIAFEELQKNEEEQAKNYANKALSHYDQSNLPKEVELCAKEIADNPKEIRRLLQQQEAVPTLKNLDQLLIMKRKGKRKPHHHETIG
jgi:hypothetical protein